MWPAPTGGRVAAVYTPSPPAAPPAAPAALCSRFTPLELRVIRTDALREYGLLLNRVAVDDLLRSESIARADLEADAAALLSAVASLCREAVATLPGAAALRRLNDRLRERTAAAKRFADTREDMLRDEGRAAWRAEADEAARSRQEAAERREFERRSLERLFAACAFVAGAETRARGDVVAEELEARARLGAEGAEGHADAERRAHERFLASPEQVALREERERREAAAAKATARRMKRFITEQKHLVTSCTHARGRVSMFEGPQAKRMCVACAVKFDDTLGYFVRMRGKTISPPPSLPLPPPPVVLPPIDRRRSTVVSLGKK